MSAIRPNAEQFAALAFIDMVSKPGYQKAHEHREAGLERTMVLATSSARTVE